VWATLFVADHRLSANSMLTRRLARAGAVSRDDALAERGENISENVPCQKNNYSNNGEYWGDRYVRFIVVAALCDKGDEGTKHGDDRDCIHKPAKDLWKRCGIHFWPPFSVSLAGLFIGIGQSQY
jgi:hypothetical protein